MNRIAEAFTNKPIFMPYFPIGYPDLHTSIGVIEALAANGADLIELGFSFSDPLADGPVIQKATQKALENGVTTRDVMNSISELRRRGVNIPFIMMGYYNPILAYGLEHFVRDARNAGADGFIIPDLPPEESEELAIFLKDLPQICMLAPTTPDQRIKKLAPNAKGFIYLVSVTGVTGTRTELPSGIPELIGRVRKYSTIPICIGFGISSPEQASALSDVADGVIVGSACVRTVGESQDPVRAAREFAIMYSSAIRSKPSP